MAQSTGSRNPSLAQEEKKENKKIKEMQWCPGLGFPQWVSVEGTAGKPAMDPCPSSRILLHSQEGIIPSGFSRVLRKTMFLPGVKSALRWEGLPWVHPCSSSLAVTIMGQSRELPSFKG